MHRSPALARALLSAALLLGTCSCAATDAAGTAPPGALTVVASTDVYGQLAAAVGGGAVAVTSLITGSTQDPHSYEASAHDELALSRADVVIVNGGGYDDVVRTLLHAAGGSPTVLDAVDLSGDRAAAGGELNEHVWYDLAAVTRFVQTLSDTFARLDPSGAGGFAGRAAELRAGLTALQHREAALRASYAGTGVVVTEPLPDYLVAACGLVDRTPARFADAVEADLGVPVGALHDTEQLVAQHRVAVVLENAQTSGAETAAVVDTARAHDVPVVALTETLPTGRTYLQWMGANLDALSAALAHAAKAGR